MKIYLLPALVALACFLAHLPFTLAGRPLRQRGVAGFGCLVAAAFGLSAYQQGTWTGLYVFFLSALAAYTYFHLFNMALTARRIELLLRRQNGDQNPYGPVSLLEARVERLAEAGVVELKDGTIHHRPGVLLAAAILFESLRRLFYKR